MLYGTKFLGKSGHTSSWNRGRNSEHPTSGTHNRFATKLDIELSVPRKNLLDSDTHSSVFRSEQTLSTEFIKRSTRVRNLVPKASSEKALGARLLGCVLEPLGGVGVWGG